MYTFLFNFDSSYLDWILAVLFMLDLVSELSSEFDYSTAFLISSNVVLNSEQLFKHSLSLFSSLDSLE